MRKIALAGAALALAVSGCTTDGSGDDPSATGEPTGAPSETAAATPSESPSETPSETPTTEPATGELIDVSGVSVRVPEKWEPHFVTAVSGTATGWPGLMVMGAQAGPPRPLRWLMKRDLELTGPVEDVRRLPDVTLDGHRAYHYTARESPGTVREGFGTWDDGYMVFITFDLHRHRASAEKRREVVESVMATYSS